MKSAKNLLGFISLLFLLTSCQTQQNPDTQPKRASNNPPTSPLFAAIKAALPAEDLTRDKLDYNDLTNSLCQESERGNNAAEGIWGFILIAKSHSHDELEAGLQLASDSAEKGYVPVMVQLGLLYFNGQIVRKNYDEAYHWFSLAASKGDPEAEAKLGVCYHYGLGTTPDLSMTALWYRRAADQTNYVAMKSLGYLYANGLGVEKNLEEAKLWSLRAAKEGGNARAMYNLGCFDYTRFSDANALADAFYWFKKSAELGDPLACVRLADCYQMGWGVETNLASYHYWLIKSATLGATEAQYIMGRAYRIGDGVPVNDEISLFWYGRAAAKNHPAACYDLAVHYLEDKTNRDSLITAHNLMIVAARGGHRDAELQCALSDFRGDFGTPDFEGGEQWLAKAAEAGWGKAEFYLFQLYYTGIAPTPECPSYPKDKTEALKWLRRAADDGNLQAQGVLAVMLIRGTDVVMDKPAGEKLLRYGAEHGYAQAQNDLGFAIESVRQNLSMRSRPFSMLAMLVA
jgi:uncharacterized protein